MPIPPPPLKRRNMAPLATGPPLSKEETPPPLRFFHQIAHELPFFAYFPECDIVCLMPNSPPCFALTEFDYCCAPKQIKGLVRVF